MVHASSQFTPPQLLEAAHRAEAEGKLDLAAQFYRHLTDHHAHTAEAAEARNGLGRIGAAQSQIWHANGAAHGNGGAHAADAGTRGGVSRAPRRRPVAPRDLYRTGRALAVLFSGIGWLMVLAGLVAPALYVMLGGGLPRVGLLPMAGGAAGLFVLGFFVVFAGQIARAVFDQANATRELVALERAKIGSD